jgi:hypothetical protein
MNPSHQLSITLKFVSCWHNSSIPEQPYKGNGKVVPVHTMKAYGWSGGRTPLILTPGSGWRQVVSLMKRLLYPQRKNHLAPKQQNSEWKSQLVWSYCRREKSLAPGRIYTLDHPTCSLTF